MLTGDLEKAMTAFPLVMTTVIALKFFSMQCALAASRPLTR